MLAGLARQALGGALLRARMEARKAGLMAAAGLLLLTALTLAGAAGIVVLSARYGIVAGLLAGAGLLALMALLVFLLARRVPGAEAPAQAVQAEAALEGVPAPGVPDPRGEAEAGTGAASGLEDLVRLHDDLRGRLDGMLPPGGQGALAAAAARQLAARPAVTLVAAAGIGAAIGLLRTRRGVPAVTPTSPEAPGRPEAAPGGRAHGPQHRPPHRPAARRPLGGVRVSQARARDA